MTKPTDALSRAIAHTEAETVLLQIKTRHELLKACHQLMPKAVREAKGAPARKARGDKPAVPAKRGSPALLRLISRIVLRPISTKSSPD
jgi:hypothetical protein